jgi:hypothetical protein
MARPDLFTHLPRCADRTPQGTVAVTNVGHLRPTQNAVGMDEVNDKVSRMKRRGDADLRAYLLERTMPVVIGNGGHQHLIDHHHLELLHGSRTGDPIGSFWKGTGSSGQESQEVFS